MSQDYSWYVEPLDSHTNEVLARELDDCWSDELKDGDGRFHQVWRCPDYSFITRLRQSRDNLQIDFVIYSRKGNGPIRRPPFVLSSMHRTRDLRNAIKRPPAA